MRTFAHPIWKLRYLMLALTVAGAVPSLAQDSGQATKTAGEAYKNIQVLKDIACSAIDGCHEGIHA